jgi:hypothetical protein
MLVPVQKKRAVAGGYIAGVAGIGTVSGPPFGQAGKRSAGNSVMLTG